MDEGRDRDIAGGVAEGVQASDFREASEKVMVCLCREGKFPQDQEIEAKRAIREVLGITSLWAI